MTVSNQPSKKPLFTEQHHSWEFTFFNVQKGI